MANEYRRIRPVPDSPLIAVPAEDYRVLALATGMMMLTGFALLLAFIYFVLFVCTRFLPSLTDSHGAKIDNISGSAEILLPGSNQWILAGNGQQLAEGTTIRTRENSRAFLTLFDQSTVTLYPLTQITLDLARSNRFGKPLNATPRNTLSLRESSGRALFGVAHLNPVSALSFAVANGSARAALDEGSFIVKVTPNQTFEVVATRGSARVSAAGQEVAVYGGERTQVRPPRPPEPAILAAEDLIENPTFTQTDSAGNPTKWDFVTPPPEARDVAGRTRLTSDDSFPVVRFTRSEAIYHAEQGITQTVNQDVTDYNIVRLDLRFKVFSQNVSGGGDQGSEYPLMVRVHYLDETGASQLWVRGFYVHNDAALPVTNGQQVKAGEWNDFIGEQGLQLQQILPRPQMIQTVEVVASGHDYDSEIQRVSLVVE